jgi:hypothetical protein
MSKFVSAKNKNKSKRRDMLFFNFENLKKKSSMTGHPT